MTAANAKDFLPHVQALADGELQEQSCAGWHDVKSTTFDLHPEHYRRRPKPLEFWAGYYGGNMLGPIRDSYEEVERITVRQGLIRIVHFRQVLP